MGDIAELAKIERRRARRQKRILESAGSRLDKITRSQSALREHTNNASPPSTPVSDNSPVNKEEITIADHYPAPTDVRREKYERSLSATSTILSEQKLKKHRPAVRKLIEERLEEQANQLNEQGFLGGKVPHVLLATMLYRTSSQPKRSKNPANKYWNLIHVVCMMWLGLLAIYKAISKHGLQQVSTVMLPNNTFPSFTTWDQSDNIHFPLFRYFAILEILLLLGKLLYAPVNIDINTTLQAATDVSSISPLSTSSHSSFIHRLQENGQELIALFNRLFRDLCIIVFVIGFIPLLMNLTVKH